MKKKNEKTTVLQTMTRTLALWALALMVKNPKTYQFVYGTGVPSGFRGT